MYKSHLLNVGVRVFFNLLHFGVFKYQLGCIRLKMKKVNDYYKELKICVVLSSVKRKGSESSDESQTNRTSPPREPCRVHCLGKLL